MFLRKQSYHLAKIRHGMENVPKC